MTTTKRQLAVLFIACCACFVAGIATHSSKFWRAYQERETLDYPTVAPYANIVGGDAFLKSERWKNAQKDRYPEIRNITHVTIGRTSDTGDFTVSLIDVDGLSCILWLNGSNEADALPVRHIDALPVRSINQH